MKRKAVSKKTRFEVFKRDGFQCVYCGQTPPAVVLELDHVEPVATGGTNEETNLVTSCFDCNRGKRDIPLDQVPPALSESMDILKEREDQIKEYRKFKKAIRRRENKDFKDIENILAETYENTRFTKKFKMQTLQKFFKELDKDAIEESMWLATSKVNDDPERCIRYFCGVCWRKIKGPSRFYR